MSDSDALLRSILENPGDDTPRLVYADHAEENGEPERAEFVRVQCELASVYPTHCAHPKVADEEWHRKSNPTCPACELRRRERELFSNVWKWIPDNFTNVEWAIDRQRTSTRHFMEQESEQYIDFDWSRGFISRIRCSWADWLRIESRLVWVPGGTVECSNCEGAGEFTRDNSDPPYGPCPDCGGTLWTGPFYEPDDHGWDKGTGRIPRPFVASMQPVEMVEFSHFPGYEIGTTDQTVSPYPHHDPLFIRKKCPKCGGGNQIWLTDRDRSRYPGPRGLCPDCHGRPLNSWTCKSWPMQKFRMPLADSGIELRLEGSADGVNWTPIAFSFDTGMISADAIQYQYVRIAGEVPHDRNI